MSTTSENGILNRGYQYVKTTLEPDTPTEQDDKAAEKEFGLLERGTQFIKNTLEPSNIDEDIEIDHEKRNTLIKTGAATTSLVGLAGCAGQSQPATSTTQKQENSTQQKAEQTTEKEDQGLQLGFTEQDMWEKETEIFERLANWSYGDVTPHELAVEYAEQHGLYDLDFTDQEEVEDTISAVTYGTVTSLGERTEGASSNSIPDAAAAINIELNKALEGTEYQAQLIPEIENGHGSAYFASTELPLLTVDSNTRNVGTVQEKPLEDRNNSIRDPLAEFDDKDFDEVDERERPTYRGFPKRIYSAAGEGKLHVGITPDVVDEFYEQAVFADDDRDLWMGPVREAVATLSNMIETNYFENAEAVGISSTPQDLPAIDGFDSFDEYATDLLENHVERYDSVKSFKEKALEP